MGYRSDVSFILKFKSQGKALKFREEVLLHASLNENFDWIKGDCYVAKRYFIFDAENLKWYTNDFEDVKYLVRLYEGWENLDGCVGMRFARVGEDDDDFESTSDGDCDDLLDMLSVDVMLSKDFPCPEEDKEDAEDS
jgi:hypothetical protein